MSQNLPVRPTTLGGCASVGAGAGSRFDLVDLQSRVVRYVRFSVTDRCNFRCTYCMPAEGAQVEPRHALLSFDEIERLARIFVGLGVVRLRLTGGEPLVRRDIVDLVAQLAQIPGVEDLAMTTNAFRLGELAEPLRAAGLRRLNVSLDTVDAAMFTAMTRNGALSDVLEGLDAADRAGFTATKINAVVVRGSNDQHLPALAAFCQARGYVLRLIEYMPIGLDQHWGQQSFVAAADMRQTLQAAGWQLHEGAPKASFGAAIGGGPARYQWATPPGGGEPLALGFITAVSDHFCATCNRVRVNASGTLRECLSTPGRLSLRDAMRAGLDDDELRGIVRLALAGKVDGHRFMVGTRTVEAMSSIGG